MKKSPYQNILYKIRNKTPLKVRQWIGPKVANIIYNFKRYTGVGDWKPNVLSFHETLDAIIKDDLSMIRFGDGEIALIDGLDLGFQKKDDKIIERLEEVIKDDTKGLMLCVPGIWKTLDVFEPIAYGFNKHHLYRCGHVWKSLLMDSKVYGDTNITRPYLFYKNKELSAEVFKKLFSLWEGKDVVLIEGEKSRLGVGNDMFDRVRSMKRILCPPENAFDKYNEILQEAEKVDRNSLILVSLGPTAKVLAYDLFKKGYRVLDIGHIDMEYEMFLRKADKQEKVPYKYFNEINERNPEECKDEKYVSQIITTIKL